MDARIVESIQSMDLVESGERHRKKLRKVRKSAGLDEIGQRPDIELPSIPTRDGCGDDYCGSLRCSRCECAFCYSKECQKVAWKQGGHK